MAVKLIESKIKSRSAASMVFVVVAAATTITINVACCN